jgi:PAS domain S-box-containing protein
MISPWILGFFALAYIGILFGVALWAEARAAKGRNVVNNPWVYSLTFAVYCTSWTYYGSVGAAANTGYLFLAIYFGPMACVFLWWNILRKMVRIKNRHHITSIADFISARYDRSQNVAAIATLIVVAGITPYIALQLKSLFTAFRILAGPGDPMRDNYIAFAVVVLLSMFTIIFGARRLDPTERHSGMVAALAVECIIKLVAFLVVGIFVTYGLFDGFGDVFDKISQTPLNNLQEEASKGSNYLIWTTYTFLAMSAILLLPRQFHVAVVENSSEKHLLTSMWLFPLYLFLINIFVLPIAVAGLSLGMGPEQADTYVLRIPLEHSSSWLPIFVFLGGFSAATGMVIVETMTIATMITNHWVVPLSNVVKPLNFLRRNLLKCRWVAIVGTLGLGYLFERTVGETYMLVNIGILSFAAVLQFAPAVVGGLYWRSGNRLGALLGLWGGFIMWVYTLLLPAFIRSGWFSADLLVYGPLGIGWLKPEGLFGMTALDPLSHSVFWTLFVNGGLYVGVPLVTSQRSEERRIAEEFVGALVAGTTRPLSVPKTFAIDIPDKIERVRKLLLQYLPPENSSAIIESCIKRSGIRDKASPTVPDLVQFFDLVETNLSGAIGAASAHRAFEMANLLTPAERELLSRVYGDILADLKLTPQELRAKVDYYRDREMLLKRTGTELELKVAERDREITERKRIEETLRASEQRQSLLLESSPEPILSYDSKTTIVFVNKAFENLFGWSRNEVLGRQLDFFIPESEREKTRSVISRIETGETVRGFETSRLTKKGDLLYVQLSASPFFDNERRWAGGIGFLHDVTDQKRAEEMLRLLAAAVQHSAEAVLISDVTGKIIYGNAAFEEMSGYGWSSLDNIQSFLNFEAEPEKGEELRSALTWQRVWKGSSVIENKDGTQTLVEVTVSPIQVEGRGVSNFVAICRDVTAERRLEEHLQRRQKLDAIGTLAGGIAHDFNNILQPMIGFTEIALDRVKKDPVTVEYLERVLSTAERARSLIRQILAFARPGEGRREPVHVTPVMEDIYKFLRASLPSTLEIRLNVETQSDVVLADETNLHQMIINLCTNAAHAMEGRDGVMTLSLSDFTVDSAMLASHPDLKEGEYLLVTVSDTGIGMSREIMAHIFEPFFTTKEKSKGTGLGLSVVHGIVKELGGAISVYSEEGKGSTFKIFIPKTKEVVKAVEKAPQKPLIGNERILFVDDEADIRDLVKLTLEGLGYRIDVAKNGLEALERLKADISFYDAVITDYTMPGMTGLALAHEVKGLRPALPVILCTGYNESHPGSKLSGLELDGFLSKPFTLRELSSMIRGIFDKKKEPPKASA